MKELEIKKGSIFGMLTIDKEVFRCYQPNGSRLRRFKCRCRCGNIAYVRLASLNYGNTKTCGCTKKYKTKHGMSGTRIYNIRRVMKQRCNNIKDPRYASYGGRGITYNKKREKFENFYKDMKEGYADKLSIDRINNNGSYCKENCRWATDKEQANNRRNNILIIYKGKEVTVSELSKYTRTPKQTIYSRIKIGRNMKNIVPCI